MAFHRTIGACLTVCLLLSFAGEPTALSSVYEVQKGDTLWSISKAFNTSVKELKALNGLKGNQLRPGQMLKLGTRLEEIQAENGPYYWRTPLAEEQEGRNYLEAATESPASDYRSGRRLLKVFDADLARRAAKSRTSKPLKGWRIVIDPGHGGLDPGAIVANRDGNGHDVYVVEDEYVYDIAMRVYERLSLLGARVRLTLISPNHLIRDNLRASVTFVHEQNEVYNDETVNRKKSNLVRPRSANISQRVRTANRFLKGASRGKSLFVSIHADNSPGRPKGPLAIYLKRKGRVDKASRAFARVMLKALDQPDMPAQIQGRSLAVLRNNRAHAEILVEVHNVHDKGEAYRIRFHRTREVDADRIVKGILNYAAGR